MNEGRHVFANFHSTYKSKDGRGIKFVDWPKLMIWLQKGNKFPLNSATLLLDEAHKGIDSREWKSPVNKILSYFLFEARKLGLDIFYVTQVFMSMDKRVRRNTEFGIQRIYDPNGDDTDFVYSWQNLRTFKIKRLVITLEEARRNLWPYYDTTEHILSPTACLDKATLKSIIEAVDKAELEQWGKDRGEMDGFDSESRTKS